ncbi:hypothetical protein EUX98_g8666 [Antrodiella citrinella]|uniref:Integrase catalytic domain-containing protein n=1 Tax=Antrodiella citrinella TaxID=2447956 RepID=A0A4S4M4D4_9APHY|nr:hypothetical protein EUX98_g8666 [Antrodiella citrinella]
MGSQPPAQAHLIELHTTAESSSPQQILHISTASPTPSNTTWLGDTGAASHVVRDRSLFHTYIETPGQTVKGAGTGTLLGRGTVKVIFRNGTTFFPALLTDVLHVPSIDYNLISLGRLTNADMSYFGKGDNITIYKNSVAVCIGKKDGHLYRLSIVPTPRPATILPVTTPRTWYEWHRTLGHLNIQQLKQLYSSSHSTGMHVDHTSDANFTCEDCIQAKHTITPTPKISRDPVQYKNFGDLFYLDVWGKSPIASLQGNVYFALFIDAATRFAFIFFMKQRDQIVQRIEEFQALLDNQYHTSITILRVDNAPELTDGVVRAWCNAHGVIIQTSTPYSPALQGSVERQNRVIAERGRAMLFSSKLPSFLWQEAFSYVIYLRNRSPTRALDGDTPFHALTRRLPDLTNIREFGTRLWALIPSPRQTKLTPKSEPYQFTGISEHSAGYRYFVPATRQILTSRNVIFPYYGVPSISPSMTTTPPAPSSDAISRLEGDYTANLDRDQDKPEKSETRSAVHISDPSDSSVPPIHRSTRQRHAVNYRDLANFGIDARNNASQDVERVYITQSSNPDEPTISEALSGPDAQAWTDAMKAELDQHAKIGTWKLVDLPAGQHAIGRRWVLLVKRNADGTVNKFKARLVAQGFSQIPGQDFSATYAPVMRLESFRVLLHIAASLDMEIDQVDVVGAYLQSELSENIFMNQPPGFEDGTGRVCLLQRALYGLKQAGRVWNTKLNGILVDRLHFIRLNADYCIYLRRAGDSLVIIIIHVDDMAIFASDKSLMTQVKAEIASHVPITDLGPIKFFLGLHVDRNRPKHSITLHQSKYIRTILDRFHQADAHTVSTPLDQSAKLCARTNIATGTSPEFPYANAIGSLMYAAVSTRPDISYAVQTLSQFTSNFDQSHINAVKHVFRYLKATPTLGITFRTSDVTLSGYSDADWGQDLTNRRSISGYFFMIGRSPISWSSKKQSTVALSSMEAEYLALSHATKESIWLRSLLRELGFPQANPSIIFCDNQSAIAFTRDNQFHARSKHIDIRHHFIRETIASKDIDVTYTPSQSNSADLLTKPLNRVAHARALALIGISPD